MAARTGWRLPLLGVLIALIAVIAGCGGTGSSGGVNSPTAALTLAVDKTSLASGETLVATVTLASTTDSPVNGVKVRVMSSNTSAIATGEGTTDSAGVARVTLNAKWIAANSDITLQAGADGITASSSVSVKVLAPKLTVTLPPTTTFTATGSTPGAITRIVLSGTSASFVNGNSNPITNQPIDITVTSITNQLTGDTVTFYPSPGVSITSPSGVLRVTTDNSGTATIPMAVDVVIPAVGSQHVITVNWRATTDYAGNTYVVTGSSSFTVTN